MAVSKAVARMRTTFAGPAGQWLPAAILVAISVAEASSRLSRQPPAMVAIALTSAGFLAVGLRRRRPLLALVLISADQLFSAATLGQGAWATLSATLALFVVSFALGYRADARRLSLGAGFVLATTAFADSRWPGPHPVFEALPFVVGFLVALPALAGWLLEDRSRLVRDLRASSAELRAERELRARTVVSEERYHLIQQLNEVVTTVMQRVHVQATMASANSGDGGLDAVADLEVVAREALAEMRALLNALTADDGRASPHALEETLTNARVHGVEIVRERAGELHLSPAVELAAAGIVEHFLHDNSTAARIQLASDAGRVDLLLERRDRDRLARASKLAIEARARLVGGAARELNAEPGDTLLVSLPAHPTEVPRQSPAPDHPHRPVRRLRTLPWLAILASAEFCLLLFQTQTSPLLRGPRPLNALTVAVMAAPIASSRRHPLASTTLSLSAFVVMSSLLTPPGAMAGGAVLWVIFPFLIAAFSTFRRALVGLGLCAVFLFISGALGQAGLSTLGGAAGVLGTFVLVAWAAGLQVGRRSRLAVELRTLNQRLVEERDLTAAEVAGSERSRVAAELHDIVGHTLTVIVLHAGAARRAWKSDRATAMESLGIIAGIASESLSELMTSIELVDSGGSSATNAVARIDHLVETVRRSGVCVHFTVAGPPRAMSRAAERAGYRVIQEAVTNAIKHAPGCPIEISLGFESGGVEIEVSNPLRRSQPSWALALAGGNGLAGIRRRAEEIGGRVAWDEADGRFSTRAWVPVGPPS